MPGVPKDRILKNYYLLSVCFLIQVIENLQMICKEYEVSYSSCETTRNITGIEESTDGMILGPEDLNYQIYDVSGKL